MNLFNKKMGKGLIILTLIIAPLAFPVFAGGYAGNVFISTAVLASSTIVGVFSSSPNQTSTGGLTVSIDENQIYDGTNYAKKLGIQESPTEYVYLLFTKSGYYSVTSVRLGSSSAPNIILPSLSFYKSGPPSSPTIGTINAGFETAKVPLSYSGDYDYSGIDLRVKKIATDSYLKETVISIDSKPSNYLIGELIDGQTLEAGGKSYQFEVSGKVAGVSNSGWNTLSFSTLTAAPIVTTETWTFRKPTGSPGINTFTIPFITNEATKPVSYETTSPGVFETLNVDEDTNNLYSIEDLIKAINTRAGSNVVTVFGWYDSNQQKHVGLTRIVYAGNNIDTAPEATRATDGDIVANILAAAILQNQSYQVTVNTPVLDFKLNFKLKGYK